MQVVIGSSASVLCNYMIVIVSSMGDCCNDMLLPYKESVALAWCIFIAVWNCEWYYIRLNIIVLWSDPYFLGVVTLCSKPRLCIYESKHLEFYHRNVFWMYTSLAVLDLFEKDMYIFCS